MSGPVAANAALLLERMKALGLSPLSVEQASPAVMRDLQRECSLCALKERCGHDLASERTAAAVADYCPNDATLKSLIQS
jgi:hypothetical protein